MPIRPARIVVAGNLGEEGKEAIEKAARAHYSFMIVGALKFNFPSIL
jgi:hypothetical protein